MSAPDGTALADPVDPLIGTQLGDFIIRERMGQGGMGIVYAGEQPMIGKRVAIKVLRPQVARDPEQVQRLLAEARAVNAIRHRGIIDIFNFGQLPDGRHYVVMEHLSGEPLDALIARRGALPPVEALEILDEVMAALGAGHEVGIIHRDLKPSNIFLVSQPDGSRYVKLLDFGLAKQSATPRGATPQTRSDMFVGTPEYVAPEQARAEDVGPYTDLYAAGVVTFEMLTARLPFEAQTPIDYVIKHLETPPPMPSTLARAVPRQVDALVLQMLAKEPSQRPPSCEAVRRDIARIRRDLAAGATRRERVPAQPPPIPLTKKAPSSGSDARAVQRSRRPLWIAGAGALALIALGAATVGPRLWTSPAPPAPPAPLAEPPPRVALPPPTALAPPRELAPKPAAPAPAAPATPRSASRAETPLSSDAPERAELLERIDRIERRLHDRSSSELPSDSVLALLKQYRRDARVAATADDRRDLARRLQKFEQRFVRR